jgi:hypothetical protein
MWAEVYKAFPPLHEPRWDARDEPAPVRKILYREDSVRAHYAKVFGNHEDVDLFSDAKLKSEKFVEKYLALEAEGTVDRAQVSRIIYT